MGRVWITILVSMLLMSLPKKCISIPTSNFTDQSALLAFKDHITFDPQNMLTHSWSSKTSFCNWMGVSCSLRRQRVTALDLSSMGLLGTIPPQLGNLSFLQYLILYNNSFHGDLPSEIGTIPSTIFNISSLKVLDLMFNGLFGSLPKNMCDHLPRLEMLLLSSNQLSGQIPSDLFKCRELQLLWLPYNNFTGVIPEELGFLPMLEVLNLGVNMLSGLQSLVPICAQRHIL
eukprot:XP_024443746.1 putative receptor-like protein kinase At3g47110 [Populus trichocarpa]